MTGLVEAIQKHALDPNFKVSDLLRHVKVAATKLHLEDTLEWVERELKGYEPDANFPDYRQVVGELKAHSPQYGVMPVVKTEKWVSDICKRSVPDSVGSIEHLNASGGGDGTVIVGVGSLIAKEMNKANGTPGTDYYVHVPYHAFINIVDQVRNLVLDWAIGLEGQGIEGEGVKFTMEEIEKAQDAAQSITINNYGHFHQGDTNGNQNKSVVNSTDNSVNTITTENVFDQLIQAIDSSIGNQNDREELLGLAEAMKAAQGTEEYKPLFQKWVGYLADYATVLGPFFPALGQLAS